MDAGESSASLLVDLGYCFLNTGRFAEARARFDEALALEPGNHFAQFQRGITLSKLGEREAAVESLLAALAEPSVRADARNELARLYTASGEIDRAVEQCRLAIEEAPYLVDAYYQLGRLLARQGKADEAQVALQRFQELNKIQEEVERFEHAARIAPDNVASLLELAKLYRRQGRSADALGIVSRAVQLSPNEPALQLAAGELLLEAGKLEEARGRGDESADARA